MKLDSSAGTIHHTGRPIVTGLAPELTSEELPHGDALFLRATASDTHSRQVFQLGSLPALQRFTVCHRSEPYWMKPAAGADLERVPEETQVLLAKLELGWLLVVPLLDDPFRFYLRGNQRHELELVGETGDPTTVGHGGLALYVAHGDDPFALVRQGARDVMQRMQTGRLRRKKPLPAFTDHFGWCTWDAFYQEVSAEKIADGLAAFAQGGVQPKCLIIDDGWLSQRRMPTGEKRLTAFAANDKFPGDLSETVRLAKEKYAVETVLAWHTIVGYWGGVDGTSLTAYQVVDQARHFGAGILTHMPAFNELWWGPMVGFIRKDDTEKFFDEFHEHLKEQGIDGVKVDSQAVLEALCLRQGSRVGVTLAYRQALEASVVKHFGGALINCMSNAQETWYGSNASTLLRSSIDFFPTMPETHGAHLYTNAQVGLWFGEFMHPDWDMFQSHHEWGPYHAAGRAISGGPVYVSDRPGETNFDLLRKLVCSDGSVLRCPEPALPTRDCLTVDPTCEDVLLKIWNRSGERGVVGVFNARYRGPERIQGTVSPSDVPGLTSGVARLACFAHQDQALTVVSADGSLNVSLAEGQFELYTFAPIVRRCAPLGLGNMFNTGAAIESVTWTDDDTCELVVRDRGELWVWAAEAPRDVAANGLGCTFGYDRGTGAVRIALEQPGAQQVVLRW